VAFLPILQEAQRIWSDPEYMQTIPKAEVCFECKFMSDISHETTHHYGSNQIARIIDVGWSLYGDGFYFVLVTPSIFKNSKSRFYCYKMADYQGTDLRVLKQDLLIGDHFPTPIIESYADEEPLLSVVVARDLCRHL